MRNGFLFTLCVFAYVSSGEIYATTCYVDQTGEVGVTTIQEAVDLAASGDTISVGPGFFDDVHRLYPPWDLDFGVVQVLQEELTIIGSGAEETTIGQQVDWGPEQGTVRGILGGLFSEGNSRLNMQDLGIEGTYGGLNFSGGGVLEVKNCRFQRNHTGIALYAPSFQPADSVFVQGCEFEPWDDMLSTQHIWTNGQNFLSVKESSFQMQEIGATKHIHFEGKTLLVEDCQFVDGRTGLALLCDQTEIRNVIFDSQEFYGIKAQGGLVSVQGCQISNTTAALYENDYDGAVRWEIDGITVSGVSESTLTRIIHES
jgi:hypothetical protein